MLRKGMFVVNAHGEVGIVVREESGGPLTVHVLRIDGTTAFELAVDADGNPKAVAMSRPIDGWRQATIAEIPASRRGEPGLLEQLGYA